MPDETIHIVLYPGNCLIIDFAGATGQVVLNYDPGKLPSAVVTRRENENPSYFFFPADPKMIPNFQVPHEENNQKG